MRRKQVPQIQYTAPTLKNRASADFEPDNHSSLILNFSKTEAFM